MAEGQDPNTPPADPKPAATPPADPPKVDVQAEIQKALADQQSQFQGQLKELTGHDSLKAFQEARLKEQGKTQELLEAKSAEAAKFKSQYEQAAVRAAVLGAASDAVDPETVLALLGGKAEVGDDGSVKVGGKPAAEAVAELLKDKPFLAKAGPAGSGSPQVGGSGAKNPWSKEHFNLTEQARIARENPAEAERLKAQAGA